MRIIREAFIATSVVMITIFLLGFLPFKTELLKPIKQEIFDFDIYDLRFTGKNEGNLARDSNIIIVEAGPGKKEIADQLVLLNSFDPAVIGVDVLFERSEDSLLNFMLEQAIAQSRSIVLVSRWPDEKDAQPRRSYFADSILNSSEGFGNFVSFDEFSVIRKYPPFIKRADITYPSFTSRIIEKTDPASFKRLSKRNCRTELINYWGNTENYTCFSYDDLRGDYLRSGQLRDKIRGKIVLLGAFSKKPPLVLEDLHFTPLNAKISGKSHPDMYGVLIHANILSMILNGNYLRELPGWVSYLLAAIIMFFISYYLLRLYSRGKKPKHFSLIILQALATVLIIFLLLWIFQQWGLKIQMLPVIIATAIGVELFEVYRKLATWLSKRSKYKTIFQHKTIV